jgi:Uma2 family endonuclease
MGIALQIPLQFDSKVIISGNRMSDDEFFNFCHQNKTLRIERDNKKNIIIMEPTGNESGFYENEINYHLTDWSRKNTEIKGITFSPSTGFILPNGATRSPDSSWVELEKWLNLPSTERKKFAHITPEFVVEIRSENDNLNTLKKKMCEWIDNGVRLAWLIDPLEKMSYIYRKNGSVDEIKGFDKTLTGEDVLKGFQFDLKNLILPE